MSAQPTQTTATADHVGRTCPYCRFTFKEGVLAIECGSCRALHHLECWQDNQGCAVMGCPSAPSPSAGTPVHPPTHTATPVATTARVAPADGPAAPVPSAAELAGQLRSWLSTPMAIAAGEAAVVALGVMAAVALVLAVVTPDTSLLGRAGAGTGLFKEVVRDVVAVTQARYGFNGFNMTLLPIAFLLVPVAGVAFGVRRSAPRLAGLPGRQRLLAAVATGIPLAVLLLVVSAFGGESGAGFSAGSVILYALLWGAIGGAIGLSGVAGSSVLSEQLETLPAGVGRWLRIGGASLRPLMALIGIGAVLSVTAWEVQILRGQDNAKLGRNTLTAVLESPFLVGEDVIEDVGLSTLATFQPIGEDSTGLLALPPDDNRSLPDFGRHYRVFAYHEAYAAPVFVLLIVALIGGALVTALFAGYRTATAAGARAPGPAAAYGASAGLVWAVIMALLRAIADLPAISGTSLFSATLLVGCVLGALGGALAVSVAPSASNVATPQPEPTVG